MDITRRNFLKLGAGLGACFFAGTLIPEFSASASTVIRPPGAKGDYFYSSCIRCFQCGSICPNRAIGFMGLEGGLENLFTPYIVPREQGCILCMKCTQVCPTDALEKVPEEPDTILERVRMGTARVNTAMCFSYNGRTCGVCYYACPYPDVALKLKTFAQPVIDPEKCVGCGLCERACLHIPQAVRVYPENGHA